MNIAIIGGGAAGFFAAITAKEKHPDAQVVIFEKSKKVLTKVKISGGGRCNLSHNAASISDLCQAYPRGGNKLKSLFHTFNNTHCVEWFESRGVPLIIQQDNCIFPASQNSQSIIDCFLTECRKLGIEIITSSEIKNIIRHENKLCIVIDETDSQNKIFDKVILTIGGIKNPSVSEWLHALGHSIVKPIPSLFPFYIPNDDITQLMGIAVEEVMLRIQGNKTKSIGALLITDWGLSGPAILKLSSFAARTLNELKYNFNLQISWICDSNSEHIAQTLAQCIKEHPNKQISKLCPFELPSRLWSYLTNKSEIKATKRWSELSKRELNKLCNLISNDEYHVVGRSKYVEEIVTCGGISLESISLSTMQSKHVKNLYFAGEVLDIDGITGGFNLQNAWTTGYIAGKLLD